MSFVPRFVSSSFRVGVETDGSFPSFILLQRRFDCSTHVRLSSLSSPSAVRAFSPLTRPPSFLSFSPSATTLPTNEQPSSLSFLNFANSKSSTKRKPPLAAEEAAHAEPIQRRLLRKRFVASPLSSFFLSPCRFDILTAVPSSSLLLLSVQASYTTTSDTTQTRFGTSFGLELNPLLSFLLLVHLPSPSSSLTSF